MATANLNEAMQTGTSEQLSNRKVLHIINGEHYSGAERVQDLLAMALPAEGYEVGFACVKPVVFPEKRHYKDAPIFECPMKNKFDITAARKIAQVATENGYELLHAHTPRTVMLARLASKRSGIPYIYHVHSPTSRDSTRGLINKLNQWIENWSIKKAEKLITVSNSLSDHLQSMGIQRDRICVVPNGVPVSEKSKQFEPNQKTNVIGSVALFRPRKGIEILIEAMSLLKDRNIGINLRAVGPFETPEYEKDIHQLADRLKVSDQINWVGFTSDVESELLQMDLFVLPSLFGEGLPMVVLEAMACGVPVIGTKVEGIPEALRDGQDGLLAEAADAADLAKKIEEAFADQNRLMKMGQNAQQRQRDRFSEKSMAKGVAEAYNSVFAEK